MSKELCFIRNREWKRYSWWENWAVENL